MKFSELTVEQFEEFATKHEQVNFHQSKEWANLKGIYNWQPYYVGVFRKDKLVAASLLLFKHTPFRKRIAYAPRGFLIDYHDKELLSFFTNVIKKFVSSKGGFFVKIDPYVPYQQRDILGNTVDNGFKNDDIIDNLISLKYRHYGFNLTFEKELQPRWIFWLPLEGKNQDDVWNNFSKDTKRYINRSTKLGMKLEEVTSDSLEDFYQIMEHTSKRRGFIDRPKSYYGKMLSTFSDKIKILSAVLYLDECLDELNKEKITLEKGIEDSKQRVEESNSKKSKDTLKSFQIEYDSVVSRIKDFEAMKEKHGKRIVLASSMFIIYGREVVYLFSGSDDEFMKYNAQYFIQWEIIKYAVENKYERYNFYGIEGNFEKENNPTYGIYEFKKGFDGEVVEFIGEFDLVIKPFYYYLYKVSFKVYKSLKRLKFRITKGDK